MIKYVILAGIPLISGVIVSISFVLAENTRFAVQGIVAPYFAAIALLFGLFANLVAGEIWQKTIKMNAAFASEISSLRGIIRVTENHSISAALVKKLADEYISLIKKHQTDSATPRENPDELKIIRDLFEVSRNLENFGGNQILEAAFVSELNNLRKSRFERILVDKSHASNLKLFILFAFGILTQIAIALTHFGKRRAIYVSVMLFSTAFSATTTFIGLIDDPEASRLITLAPFEEFQ